VDQSPVGREAKGLQERDVACQQFRYPAAFRRAVDVADADPVELSGQPVDLVDQGIPYEGSVVLQVG
jgi:hypothetical protein